MPKKPAQLNLFEVQTLKSAESAGIKMHLVLEAAATVKLRVALVQDLKLLDMVLLRPLTYDLTVQCFVSYACARGVWCRCPGDTTPAGIKSVLGHHGAQARPASAAFRYTQAKLQDCWEVWQGLGRPSRQHVRWINAGQPIGPDPYKMLP